MINQTQTKTIIFNHTNKYQFRARLKINNEILETVEETKLLGTIITKDLNTEKIVKRSYARMELLRKLADSHPPISDMKQVYITFVRSLLEQSGIVWHSSLSQQNKIDLESVQKTALKIILKDKFISYEHSLNILEIETLKNRKKCSC